MIVYIYIYTHAYIDLYQLVRILYSKQIMYMLSCHGLGGRLAGLS